jgi:hypothetical protein
MQLPKNWGSLTTNQFIELKALKEEDFGSLFLYNLEVLSIVTDTDPEELEDLSPEELVDYIYELNFLRREPSKSATEKINDLHFKPFMLLKLGEFIDLEYYFSNDFVSNLTNICALCYRKKSVNEWGVETFEPYRFNPSDRAYLFEYETITNTYGVISEYLKFRAELMQSYENLFMPDVEDTGEELDPEDLKEEQEEKKFKKWGWEKVIYDLAGEDITKADQITDLPLIMVLNFMSMKYELQV